MCFILEYKLLLMPFNLLNLPMYYGEHDLSILISSYSQHIDFCLSSSHNLLFFIVLTCMHIMHVSPWLKHIQEEVF